MLTVTKGKTVDTQRDWLSNLNQNDKQKKNTKKRNGTVKVDTHKRDWQTQPKTCWEAQIPDASPSSTMARENRAPLNAEAETVNYPPAEVSSQPWLNSHNKKETWPARRDMRCLRSQVQARMVTEREKGLKRFRPTLSHHSHKNKKQSSTEYTGKDKSLSLWSKPEKSQTTKLFRIAQIPANIPNDLERSQNMWRKEHWNSIKWNWIWSKWNTKTECTLSTKRTKENTVPLNSESP